MDDAFNLLSMNQPAPDDGSGIPNMLSMAKGLPPEAKKNLLQVAAVPGGPQRVAEITKSLLANPAGLKAPPRTSKKEQTSEDKKTTSGSRENQYNTGTLDDIGEWIRSQPEFKDQEDSAKQLQNMISMGGAQRNQNVGWIKPLSALADAQTGSNLTATAPDPNARSQTLLKYQDELSKRKNDMMKTIMEGASKLKTGQQSQSQIDDLKRMVANQSGDFGLGGRAGAYMLSLGTRAGKDLDAQTKDSRNSVESLNRGDSFLTDKSFPLTQQALNQVQQDISKGLIGGGQITDARVKQDMQEVFAGALQTLKTKYTGKFDPNKDDLRLKIPEVVAQIKLGLDKIRGEFNGRIHRDVDQAAKTYEPLYDMVPGLERIVEGKRAFIKARHPKPEGFTTTGAFQAPGSAPAAAPAADPYANMSDADIAALHAKVTK